MTRTDATRRSIALCAGTRPECAECLHFRGNNPGVWSDIPDYDPATLDRVSGEICVRWGWGRG